MIYIAYCSAATHLMSSAELTDLLRICRRNNERDDVTGMLLYREGSFMQVLEGDEEPVLAAYERICQDARHQNVIRLMQGPIDHRSFDHWSMGFFDVRDLKPEDRSAWSDFLEKPFDGGAYAGGRALKLLTTFKTIGS